jgi:ABC-type polar amino acid transport system ATPase subunit
VDDLTFTVRPGVVTGFLGPNGAGKSTTMRAILCLDRPTRGQALVAGRRYVDHPAPLCVVGALLEAGAAHPGRSAVNHLREARRHLLAFFQIGPLTPGDAHCARDLVINAPTRQSGAIASSLCSAVGTTSRAIPVLPRVPGPQRPRGIAGHGQVLLHAGLSLIFHEQT